MEQKTRGGDTSIERVSCDGEPGVGKLNARLMGPSGLETERNEGARSSSLQDFAMGYGERSPVGNDRHGAVVAWSDAVTKGEASSGRAADAGDVVFVDGAGLEGGCEHTVGFASKGEHHDPRGIAVETLVDA